MDSFGCFGPGKQPDQRCKVGHILSDSFGCVWAWLGVLSLKKLGPRTDTGTSGYQMTDTSIQGSLRYHGSFGDRRHRSLASPPAGSDRHFKSCAKYSGINRRGMYTHVMLSSSPSDRLLVFQTTYSSKCFVSFLVLSSLFKLCMWPYDLSEALSKP